jgi:hypothetical protein
VCDGIEIEEVIDRKTGQNAVILFQAFHEKAADVKRKF